MDRTIPSFRIAFGIGQAEWNHFTMLWIIGQKTEAMKEKRRSSLVPKGEAVAK
jgi:hypothetical protein